MARAEIADALAGASADEFALRRRRLFDLDFVDDTDLQRVVVDILSYSDAGVDRARAPQPVVITPNVDYLVRLRHASPTVCRVVDDARWCLPDGQPIVWASRIVGRPLGARLAGSSLVEAIWTDPDFASVPFAVIASSDPIAAQICASHAGSHVVVAPVLPADDPSAVVAFVDSELDALVAQRPALVFVAIGFPKEQIAIDAMLARWPTEVPRPVFLAVGASFEMLFGLRKRAPGWMQRSGLEWLFRFAQEPRRLFVRYFVRDPVFFVLVARAWRRRHDGQVPRSDADVHRSHREFA